MYTQDLLQREHLDCNWLNSFEWYLSYVVMSTLTFLDANERMAGHFSVPSLFTITFLWLLHSISLNHCQLEGQSQAYLPVAHPNLVLVSPYAYMEASEYRLDIYLTAQLAFEPSGVNRNKFYPDGLTQLSSRCYHPLHNTLTGLHTVDLPFHP